jgi:hypothetical protein
LVNGDRWHQKQGRNAGIFLPWQWRGGVTPQSVEGNSSGCSTSRASPSCQREFLISAPQENALSLYSDTSHRVSHISFCRHQLNIATTNRFANCHLIIIQPTHFSSVTPNKLQKLIFVTYYSITIFAFDYQGQLQWLN